MNDEDIAVLSLHTSLVFVVMLYTSTGVVIIVACTACCLGRFPLIFDSFLRQIPIMRHSKRIRDNAAAVAIAVNENKAI